MCQLTFLPLQLESQANIPHTIFEKVFTLYILVTMQNFGLDHRTHPFLFRMNSFSPVNRNTILYSMFFCVFDSLVINGNTCPASILGFST